MGKKMGAPSGAPAVGPAYAAATPVHREINRRIVQASSLSRILEIIERSSQDFNAVNISTAFHRLAKTWHEWPDPACGGGASFQQGSAPTRMQSRLDSCLLILTDLALKSVQEFQGQGLGIIIWAFAKIGYDSSKIRPLLDGFAREAARRLNGPVLAKMEPNLKLGAQSLSNLVYAYASLSHHPGSDLLSAIAKGVQWQLRDFSPQGLSNIAWAYAKLDAQLTPEVVQLLEALAVEAASQLMDASCRQKFIPQNLSNMLYGYAVLGYHPGPSLLVSIAKEALRQLREFGPQELTNMVWAYAKLGGPLAPPVATLLDSVPDVVQQLAAEARHHKVKPQTISNLLWAYATLNRTPKKLLATLSAEAMHHMSHFKPQEIANCLWAYAALDYSPGAAILGEMARSMQSKVQVFKAQELSCALWGLATLRHHPGNTTLSSMLSQSQRMVDNFKPQELANLVLAFAKLGFQEASVLTDSVISLGKRSSGFKAADVCNVVWALAVLESWEDEAAAAFGPIAAGLPAGDFTQEGLALIFEARLSSPEAAAALEKHFPPSILQRAEAGWHERTPTLKPLKIQKEVASTLEELGVSYELEFQLDGGLLLIEIALPKRQVAVEVSSPSAFSVNKPYRLLGSTQLRWRMLGGRGWQVLCVPFYVWSGLHSKENCMAYLQQLLDSQSSASGSSSESSNQNEQDRSSFEYLSSQFPAQAAVSAPFAAKVSSSMQHSASSSFLGSVAPIRSQQYGPSAFATSQGLSPLPVAAQGLSSGHKGQSLDSAVSTAMHIQMLRAELEGMSPSAAYMAGSQPLLSAVKPNIWSDPLPNTGSGDSPFRSFGLQSPSSTSLVSLSSSPVDGNSLASLLSNLSANSASPDQGATGLQQIWELMAQRAPAGGMDAEALSSAQRLSEAPFMGPVLRRQIESLPLDASSVATLGPQLSRLPPAEFGTLCRELVRDNLAFRAWQLFDWIRSLPADHELQHLCDASLFAFFISLCLPSKQLPRALQLVADMSARSLELGMQGYGALFNAAIKAEEIDLAITVYRQMMCEGGSIDRQVFLSLIDAFCKLSQTEDALSVLEDMRRHGLEAEVATYNQLIASCSKSSPAAAADVYQRMVAAGTQPNSKTFTALIGAFSKCGPIEQALDVIQGLVRTGNSGDNCSSATFGALMNACEKAGQWDLAIALFDKMCAHGCRPDVGIFNLMIAACAHGGEYLKARVMFDRMASHSCRPDAATFANLIRAYKKGGQWCHALDVFEAMLEAGFQPHAAVYSSVIDLLWQTGVQWAQAKALSFFEKALQVGAVAPPVVISKKGALRLDLQALTAGVAVLGMARWLATDAPRLLEANKKLTIVNGLGDHSRAQGNSSAVKAVSTSLNGCRGRLRMVQEQSRSGRLEVGSVALLRWLSSPDFAGYRSMYVQQHARFNGPTLSGSGLCTTDFLHHEAALAQKCGQAWEVVCKHEAMHSLVAKAAHTSSGNYFQQRRQLVQLALQLSSCLQLPDQVPHAAVGLMDRVVMSGALVSDSLEAVFVVACIRLAAASEGKYLPRDVSMGIEFAPQQLERMENHVCSILKQEAFCISPLHCLLVFAERLGCQVGSSDAVCRVLGSAFALVTEALFDTSFLQYPSSVTAAAALTAARKAQGAVPGWPSVLAAMTGLGEGTSPVFSAATADMEQLANKLFLPVETSLPGLQYD